jgi:mono/diheme cytochrome c family protein
MVLRISMLLVLALGLSGAATAPSTMPSTQPATAPATAPATRPATGPAASKSTFDGVSTTEQIARGKKSYFASCARCHGDTLLGNDDAVALVGGEFVAKWSGGSVGKLVEYTRKEMPSDGPGKISRRECTDIIAYLLNANGVAVGKVELLPELEDLNDILIQVKK